MEPRGEHHIHIPVAHTRQQEAKKQRRRVSRSTAAHFDPRRAWFMTRTANYHEAVPDTQADITDIDSIIEINGRGIVTTVWCQWFITGAAQGSGGTAARRPDVVLVAERDHHYRRHKRRYRHRHHPPPPPHPPSRPRRGGGGGGKGK